MEELSKENYLIKTDEIFLNYKYKRIPTKFNGNVEKGVLASDIKTKSRASYRKLSLKDNKEIENDAENNTLCDSMNNADIINEEDNLQDNRNCTDSHGNFNKLDKDNLINRKNNLSIKSGNEINQIKCRGINKIDSLEKKEFQAIKSLKKEDGNLIQSNKDDEDIIPLSTKIIYSLASFGKMSCLVLLNIHALLFYESIGASLLYMSFFVALARAVEIILKPVVAHISDVTNTRFGRRKPYMICGCFFYAFFLILLFCSPGMKAGSTYISMWFGVFYTLFFIADTFTNVPYLALGPELSTNSREREKLYLYFYIFQYIGVLFAAAAPVILNRFYPPCDCSFCLNTPEIVDIPKCINKCQILCNVKTNQSSLFYISLFIGVFYIISILLIFFKIPEKKIFKDENNRNSEHSKDDKEQLNFKKINEFFIPSLYRLANNKPFLMILTPWIIDLIITTIFASMLPFFLNFVINPQKYCKEKNLDLHSDDCNVNIWLAYSISIFFISCIFFTLMWHYLVKKIGKKKCWQSYSLISILVFSFFLLCDKGSMRVLLVVSFFCSIPAGGAYLNDVFISDIIDYDEFICGQRNEGVFTVFSAFVPKVVSIFAQSIPLTIMTYFELNYYNCWWSNLEENFIKFLLIKNKVMGFVSSNNGENQDQPEIVVQFIRFYFILFPCILALISFIYKIDYPIDNDNLMDGIRSQIDSQKSYFKKYKGKVDYVLVYDPIMKNEQFNLYLNSHKHITTFIVAEHFSSLDYLRIFFYKDLESLQKQIKMNILGAILLLIIFLITLISTFTFLQNKNLNLIPLFSLFILSISIIALFVNVIRYKVLKKIEKGDYILDYEFLRLYILKKYFEQENVFDLINQHNKIKTSKKEFENVECLEDENNINQNNINNKYNDFIEEVDISKYLFSAIKKKSNH